MNYELPWNGKPFPDTSTHIAIDTETDSRGGKHVQDVVLATASDGTRTVVLAPHQLPKFLASHAGREFVFHNAAFDFWSLHKAVGESDILWDAAENNRLHCTMLLDQLVRLATGSKDPSLRPRGLGEVARQLCGLHVDKDVKVRLPGSVEPVSVRLSYHLLQKHWPYWWVNTASQRIDRSWFTYACDDTRATILVWKKLVARANEIQTEYNLTTGPHGLLTEALQVRASLALAEVGRRGICIDQTKRAAVAQRLRSEIDADVAYIEQKWPGCFKKYASKKHIAENGLYRRTANDLPSQNLKFIGSLLSAYADEAQKVTPLTEKGSVQISLETWRFMLPENPFVQRWGHLVDASKTYQFVNKIDRQYITSRYNALMRTGRTSCTDENIQQMPREAWFRELFVARPGCKFVVADYATIELRTLAQICRARYGKSVLGDVIEQGIDPHAFTAASITEVKYDDFLKIKKDDPKRFKQLRQGAKAVNFGVPGGLGPRRLVDYAATQYGVTLTLAEATEFRQRLITDIYPEIGTYLHEEPFCEVADVCRCRPADVWSYLRHSLSALFQDERPEWLPWVVQKVASGQPVKADGTEYAPYVVDGVWEALAAITRRGPREIRELVDRREGGIILRRLLFGRTVVTETGRVRVGCDFGESRNTAFQGLAADGAKIALWKMLRAGLRVVAFIHDEVIVEAEDHEVDSVASRTVELMKAGMAAVVPSLPIEVEFQVTPCWAKP